ncbi:MAG: c-type cytochrome [Paracoccaceae bacterium]
MFDTMTSTKVIGALCGTLLIFLFANWAAESLYHVGPAGHGDEAHNAYPIETDDGHAEESAEVEVDFAMILASADADKGAKVFNKCKACHKLEDGVNGVGPTLFGVLDRDIASVDGFGYTGVLTELPGNWTAEALSDFLENPKSYAAGTKMSFSGLKKIDDRANVIAYLGTIGG